MTSQLTSSAAESLQPSLFPPRTTPTPSQVEHGIQTCLTIQRRAVQHGKRPFAACLIAPDNETVLLQHQSIDQVNHAESSLARLAYSHYSKECLWQCTLYSTWEPCGMCSATIYWAHIGRVVFAASNEQLAELTGVGNKENFTMKWGCREILGGGQKDVEVFGPVEGLDKVVLESAAEYWKKTMEESSAESTGH